jgi:hypothetical protein
MTALTPKTSMPTRSTLGRLGRVALTGAVAVASLGLSGCYYPARTHATVTYSSAPQQQYHVVQAPTAQVYTSSQPAPVTTYVTQDGTIYAEPEPTYTVYQAPPPPRQVVVQQRAPSQGAVWVNGHWQWNGYQYIWVDGYWVQPQQGYTYVQPRWEQRGGAYVYVQGYQRPSRVVVRQPQHRTVVVQQQPQPRQTTVVVQPQQPRTRTVVVQPQPQPQSTVVTCSRSRSRAPVRWWFNRSRSPSPGRWWCSRSRSRAPAQWWCSRSRSPSPAR